LSSLSLHPNPPLNSLGQKLPVSIIGGEGEKLYPGKLAYVTRNVFWTWESDDIDESSNTLGVYINGLVTLKIIGRMGFPLLKWESLVSLILL